MDNDETDLSVHLRPKELRFKALVYSLSKAYLRRFKFFHPKQYVCMILAFRSSSREIH